MDVFAVTILISLVVYVAVGNYAGRRVKNVDDYYVAGRQAPTLLIVGSLIASYLSTNAFLGETGEVYAGSRGVIITDTIMFCLFSGVSMAAMIYVVHSLGGWDTVMAGLAALHKDTGMLDWHGQVGPGYDWPSALEVGIWATVVWGAWGVVAAISPWQSSRYLIAKNEQVVIRAGVLCAIALPILNEITYFPAVAINLVNPDIEPSAEAMIWLSLNMLPPLLGAVLLTGILAAALSSASTFLSLVGFAISNDILPDKGRDDAHMLKLTRWVMLGVGLVVLVVGFAVPMDIFWLTYYVGTVFASSWGPVAFMSVWSKTITADAAFWGMISGFVGNILARALDWGGLIDLPALLDPIIVGALISFGMIIFKSRRGEVGAEEKIYRKRLHQVPEDEKTNDWNLK